MSELKWLPLRDEKQLAIKNKRSKKNKIEALDIKIVIFSESNKIK